VLRWIRRTLVLALGRVAVVTASILVSYPGFQPTAVAAGSLLATPPANRMHVALAVAAAPVDFPTILERYGLAVVNISAAAHEKQTAAANPAPIDPDDPFFVFFKHARGEMQDLHGSPPRVIRGAGSGFIVSPEGLIVTTAHVVDHADEVTVKLTDRREFRARVLAVDADSDVALIKIDATKLTGPQAGRLVARTPRRTSAGSRLTLRFREHRLRWYRQRHPAGADGRQQFSILAECRRQSGQFWSAYI
jgi:serine protease Do